MKLNLKLLKGCSPHRPKGCGFRRRLRSEALESRMLLAADLGAEHNSVNPEDVNVDGFVSALDALIVVNDLNRNDAGADGEAELEIDREYAVDVNGDRGVSPIDALTVINRLNRGTESGSSVPVEIRIARLREAIELGGLPQHMDSAEAEELLATLENGGRPEIGERYRDGSVINVLDGGDRPDGGGDRPDGGGDRPDGGGDRPDGGGDRPGEGDRDRGIAAHIDGLYQRFDSDNDDALVQSEVDAGIWGRIEVADADGDLAVRRDELYAAWRNNDAGDALASRIDAFYERYDMNDDGGLVSDETEVDIWGRISPADTNQDGIVLRDELLTLWSRE